MKHFFLALLFYSSTQAFAQNLAITHVTVYTTPDAPPLRDAVILFKNGKISGAGKLAVPQDARVVDGSGMYATAGFWNSHVHFTEPKWSGADTMAASRLEAQLQDFATCRGFTHVFDVAELDFENLKALKARIDKGEVPGPAIRAVGVPLTPENGSPVYIRPAKLPEIATVAAAEQAVKAQLDAGAQGIKLFTASPNEKEVVTMPVPVATAAVRAAHAAHVPVFAHPSTAAGVQVAIAAGVDILAHVSPDDHQPWPPATIQAMLAKHMALVPTLKMFQWSLLTNGADTTQNPLISTAVQQLGAYAKAGGVILFGTDVGYMSDYGTEAEFDLMHRAGMDFRQILTSLTTAPAKEFGLDGHAGKIAPGMEGDVVLLAADPAADSRNFSKVKCTIIKGVVVYEAK